MSGLSKRDLSRKSTGIYPALVRKLQDAFVHTTSDGMRPVILLDEAHDLRPESLAMLRVLTNFEMDSRLGVPRARRPATLRLLLGTPNKPPSGRIAESRLLSRDETRAYLEHRCTLAGARTNPADAQETIFEMSRGNLRAIAASRPCQVFPHHRQCRRRDRRSQVAVAMTNPLPTVPVHAIDPQPDAPQWLVRDLWTAAVGIIGGSPKVGKSSVSVASGTPALGRFPVEPPDGSGVSRRDALPRVRDRVSHLCRHRGLDLARLDLGRH